MKPKYYGYISMMCSMAFVYVIFMANAAALAIGEIESGTKMDIESPAGLCELQSTFASFGSSSAIMALVAGLAVLAAFLLVGSISAGVKAYSN